MSIPQACFTGGMLALGAQALSLQEDLEIGRKLTDGCVTLYDIMPSGVMPEYLDLMPCKDAKNCTWDEEKWLEALLPGVNFHPDPEDPTPVQKSPSQKDGAGGDDDEEEPEKETDGEEQPKMSGEMQRHNEELTEIRLGEEDLSIENTDRFIPPHNGDSQHQHIKRYPQRGPPSANNDWRHDKSPPIQRARNKAKTERLPPGVTSIRDKRFVAMLFGFIC